MKSHYIEIREAAKNSRNEKFKEKFVLSWVFLLTPRTFSHHLREGSFTVVKILKKKKSPQSHQATTSRWTSGKFNAPSLLDHLLLSVVDAYSASDDFKRGNEFAGRNDDDENEIGRCQQRYFRLKYELFTVLQYLIELFVPTRQRVLKWYWVNFPLHVSIGPAPNSWSISSHYVCSIERLIISLDFNLSLLVSPIVNVCAFSSSSLLSSLLSFWLCRQVCET